MLMLALTKDNEIIHIKDAVVKTDYYCDECGGILRVKNGTRKVKHFFHKDKDCGSEGESLIHRYWKNYFVNLKEFEGYKIVASKAEVPLLSGSYIPDVFLKNDKGTYIIIEIFYKNPKTDDYQKVFKILGDKGIEKVYEVQVDYEKILDIKTLFDREKNREIEKKKEELTENLIKKIERKRQYILEKYSKNGGLIFNIINDILCNYKDLNTKIKSKDTYNKFTDIENMINSSLKCKKFKICLVENLEFENEKILIESTPFYINIYDYRNFIDYLKRNGELVKFYLKDEDLKGYIKILFDREKNREIERKRRTN